ncbi:MAG: quinone-dependent dihydroorotate dehydrogenase [Deltaproteobacteria bacterium]|nr:quinone-dependent dihydroorotate dehydrogenase [Deltaproteobacteria bacterium]
MLYRALLRPLFFTLPAETAHHVAFSGLRVIESVPGLAGLTSMLFAHRDPRLEVKALGLVFPTPVGLAAGFDKDAVAMHALLALGFGFVEVGTLTAHAQPGNPKPRMFRLPADRALLNRLGFNNGGSEAAVARLSRRDRRFGVVGVNIGKSKITAEEDAAADYALSATRVAPHADYLVVNVSSPNTPGLRNLQAVEKLEPILRAVARASSEACERAGLDRAPSLLVKIAPDLADEDVDASAELAIALGLGGIVATNTTISRDGLASDAAYVSSLGVGGISGAPVRARSLAVLKRLRGKLARDVAIISVGGIETAEHAKERLDHGATLIQLYTGFIYGGPRTPVTIAKGLAL